MSKIGASFRNLRDRIRAGVSVKSRNVLFFLALFLIIVVAIMLRLTPILRGPTLIKAFDPWIQYYTSKYLSEHTLYEYFHWHDYKSWYPAGKDRYGLRPALPFTVVTIYHLLNAIGIPVTIYDVCYYFPAFMGGMTCLSAYLLGKEILDRRMGLLAAFFLAFNTGHAQRTMAGFFDNETIGVFAVLMTFFFFLKAAHTGKITYGILGGLFLGYLSLGWGGLSYVYLLLPLVCGLMVLLNKYNENILIAYAGVQGTGLFVYALFIGFNFSKFFEEIELGGVFLFTIILLVFHIIYTKRRDYPKFYKNLLNTIKWGIIPAGLIIAIVLWIDPSLIPGGFTGRLGSILSPLMRDQMHIVASVAEHMPSAWSIFYYNTLIPLMLIPLGIFFCFKRGEVADVLLITFLLTLFYFTGSMIRIILLFAPAAALMGSYGLVTVLKIFGSYVGEQHTRISRKRKRQVKRTIGNQEIGAVYFIVGFLCFAQIIHAADISINQLSYSQMVAGGQFHDWEDALTWMKTNLDGTDVVVSWWDYGYWLTPIGNVTTVNDNGTGNSTRLGLTGMALMQTNEIYSAKILKGLKADYVLVYFGFLINGLGGDEGKWPWMLRICNDHYNRYKEWGLEEDNWKQDAVFDEDEYINSSSQQYEDKWFDSQLVRLMFGYEPTDPSQISDPQNNQLRWNYASNIAGNPSAGISQRKDDNGNPWKSHIPDNGQYDFKVFRPAYFSRNGMVKLYQVDYTALESSFLIKNAKVFDDGTAIFDIKNTGSRDLTIKNIKINNIEYNFSMSTDDNTKKLRTDTTDTIWVDYNTTDGIIYNAGDTVNITASAEAQALGQNTYTFENYTKNFFASEAQSGSLRINRENSKVIQKSETIIDAYMEVENTGNSILNVDHFYLNNDDPFNKFQTYEYTSGSPILKPGERAMVHLYDKSSDFYPLGKRNNTVGVVSSRGARDQVIFSSNYENYKLSIIDEERIVSPEYDSVSSVSFRTNIPVDPENSVIYSYENGTSLAKIKVKNTGQSILGLDSLYIGGGRQSVEFNTINEDYILSVGEENIIIADLSEFDWEINDNVFITLTAIDYELNVKASDVGFLQTIRDKGDIQILTGTSEFATSYILANETGVLMVKNTGDEALTLEKVYLNDTIEINITDDVRFDYGDESLDLQEVAIFSFDIPNLKINATNNIKINVTTNLVDAQDNLTLQALVNPPQGPISYYVDLDQDNCTASASDQLELDIENPTGATLKTLTLDGTYINDTFVSLDQYDYIGPENFEVDPGESVYLFIDMAVINLIPDLSFSDGDKLKFLIRTKEGAEAEIIIDVGA